MAKDRSRVTLHFHFKVDGDTNATTEGGGGGEAGGELGGVAICL